MANSDLDFEKSIELKQIGEDVFVNIHKPWTWPRTSTIPGGLLMSEAAVAAYRTLDEKLFALDNLQAQFLVGASADKPLEYKVTKLSQGRRFAVRSVTAEQSGRICLHVVIGFVSRKEGTPKGPNFQHCVSRKLAGAVVAGGLPKDIPPELDDLAVGRNHLGSWMKFQRLQVIPNIKTRKPEETLYPVIAKMFPIKSSPQENPTPHLLGLLNLSDYHVLDAPMTIHGVLYGLPPIGDENGKRTKSDVTMFTSLNHSVHVHVQPEGDAEGKGGWRADELMYIEVVSPWAKDGRAYMQTRIFTRDGILVATCVQEAYYVLKDNAKSEIGSKL